MSARILAWDTGPRAHGMALLHVGHDSARLIQVDTVEVAQPLLWPVVDLVAIECPAHAFSAATASACIATARAAGELGGAARAAGLRTEYVTAADWRAGLLGVANAHDKAIKDWVEKHVQGLPKKTNVHVRDAIALAVFAGRRWLRGVRP